MGVDGWVDVGVGATRVIGRNKGYDWVEQGCAWGWKGGDGWHNLDHRPTHPRSTNCRPTFLVDQLVDQGAAVGGVRAMRGLRDGGCKRWGQRRVGWCDEERGETVMQENMMGVRNGLLKAQGWKMEKMGV